jgi:hypothetical protein
VSRYELGCFAAVVAMFLYANNLEFNDVEQPAIDAANERVSAHRR